MFVEIGQAEDIEEDFINVSVEHASPTSVLADRSKELFLLTKSPLSLTVLEGAVTAQDIGTYVIKIVLEDENEAEALKTEYKFTITVKAKEQTTAGAGLEGENDGKSGNNGLHSGH